MKNILLLLFLFVIILTGCSKSNSPVKDDSPVKGGQSEELTPKGVRLETVNGVSPETKNIIDESLTKLFQDSTRDGYVNGLNHSQYTIYLMDNCVQSPEQKVWSFKVRAEIIMVVNMI